MHPIVAMGATTETDIFDCLKDNFRKAADCAERLASAPRIGPLYRELREALRLVEGSCRQAGNWRQDARWFVIGRSVAYAHHLAGEWLRGIKLSNGTRLKLAAGHRHPAFLKLAENLRMGAKRAEEFQNRATGRIGLILPKELPGPHRETRPVHVSVPPELRRPSGLIVPAGMA